MRSLLILSLILAFGISINLQAGGAAENVNKEKENKKQSDTNPKAATVSMDVELKGQVVMEEKELKKSKGTKTYYYLVCPEDNRKYELPVPDVKDDPSHPERFIGKNVVIKGNTEVSPTKAKVTVIASIKESK